MGYDADEETRKLQEAADKEAENIRNKAYKLYSKDDHICTLLEDFINKRKEIEDKIESTCHIKAAEAFLNYKIFKAGVEGEDFIRRLYRITLNDILL